MFVLQVFITAIIGLRFVAQPSITVIPMNVLHNLPYLRTTVVYFLIVND